MNRMSKRLALEDQYCPVIVYPSFMGEKKTTSIDRSVCHFNLVFLQMYRQEWVSLIDGDEMAKIEICDFIVFDSSGEANANARVCVGRKMKYVDGLSDYTQIDRWFVYLLWSERNTLT